VNQLDIFDRTAVITDEVRAWRPPEPPSLDGIDEIELDCETTGLRWWEGDSPIGVALRIPNGQTFYLPWGHKPGGNIDEAVMRRWFEREVRNKHITNLNTRFDVHMLYAWGVDLEAQGCTVSDVAHYAALLDDHRRKFSLEQLGQDYVGEGKHQITIPGFDPGKMAEYHAGEIDAYARQDVNLVGKLKQKLLPMMGTEELDEVRKLEDDVIFPVCEMERNAAPIDVQTLKRWANEIEQKYLRCLWEIYDLTGMRVNPDSSEDWVKLFHARKLEFVAFTETGRPSFTDDVLKNIEDPVVQLARKAGKYSDLRSKYIVKYDKTIGSDGLLRYALHQLRADEGGTVSGRFASSKIVEGVGCNIQQVMAVEKQQAAYGNEFIVRELFIPGNGLLLSADAKQIEYRLFAHYAASPVILAAYDKDPDTSFHQLVWDLVKPFKPDIMYKAVKNLNFAKVYGAGRNKIASMLELPREESDRFVNIYDRMFPEVPRLIRKASDLAESRGYVKTLSGRRARFPDKKFGHKALNRVCQGSAADIMKMKCIELHRERKRLGLTMRMTVHDEVVGDVPDIEAARLVEEQLNRQSYELRVPILWDVNVGPNWAKMEGIGAKDR
jgi:DNA polymerase I-like protein with 3'-5' exonuclease and polymerase domains